MERRSTPPWESAKVQVALLALSVVGISWGGAAHFAGAERAQSVAWAAATAVVLLPLLLSVVDGLLRRKAGVDVIALLAMAGALALREYLAGAVIALMLSTGQSLEGYAERRARRELSALLGRAPRAAHRVESGVLVDVDIDEVRHGDLLLVKPGEVLPVDGLVEEDHAVLDESALTGEAVPVERPAGEQVRSGAANAGEAFRMRAIATAAESTYAGVVRLVQEAQASRAPFVRLADRYSLAFLPLTLATAGLAWAFSGDAVRALAVLVVATPCPLILAAPIAIVAGISRSARRGIIVKGGGALEVLARGSVLLFDKTGTLTAGMPRVADVEAFGALGAGDLLRLAASLDQVSGHVLAAAVVRAARERDLPLAFPTGVLEHAGVGIEGTVEGSRVTLGKGEWVAGGALPARARSVRRRSAIEGSSHVFVGVDGSLAGAIFLDDPIRPDSPRTIRSLRRAGIRRMVMVTGDHPEVAETLGAAIGADRVLAERSPADKVDAVKAERAEGVVIMVGDGINDAPALAAADVGVAMGARGATASSEAAEVVLVVDRLDRLAEGIRIARRSRAIALQSVLAGMGMSLVAMGAAAAGLLAPVAGAILQEAIDVAAIANALRALKGERGGKPVRAMRAGAAASGPYWAEHRTLLPKVDEVRRAADRLDSLSPAEALGELAGVRRFLVEDLAPHEEAEEARVYPVLGEILGGEDPMGTLSRAHLEISHLSRLFGKLLDDLPPEGPAREDLPDLRRVLYGLHAVLRLHFAQEEETFMSVSDEGLEAGRAAP
ncbi:MAG: heavy metal translocating P-type ATPase [Acidobacteria bacterium]|nr:heavy metal translocating P-type ATPase [Acidobacteriota bacterium]